MNYFRAFDFIKDKKLKGILILDYKEVLTSLKRQCSKAAVVLSGGITEAILKDKARKKKNRSKVEQEYKKIRKHKKLTRVKKMDLFYLIKSLENLKIISEVDAKTANILRDYRNMIHPFDKYPDRPDKKAANKVKNLLDSLIEDYKNKKKQKISLEKGKLFFTDDHYKKKRSKKEYKEIIRRLYKKKIATFQEIKSLKVIREKSNSAKSAASLLTQLSLLGICDYDKNSWQNAPIKRYEKWIFNKKFNFLAKEYLK